MCCANIPSSYDSTDDILCTHHIVLRFHWWCSVRTSHWLYDSTCDVQCTQHIAFWFCRWCSVLTSNRPYDSTDDNNLYNALRLWFQKWVHMYTRHKGYDSKDDAMCTHCTTAYDSEIILWTHTTAWLWFVTIQIRLSHHHMNHHTWFISLNSCFSRSAFSRYVFLRSAFSRSAYLRSAFSRSCLKKSYDIKFLFFSFLRMSHNGDFVCKLCCFYCNKTISLAWEK